MTHQEKSSKKRSVQLTFWGAAGTVTGSRYLLENQQTRILIDCGLFQGYKNLRQKNWKPFPVSPASIEAIFLTHAHLDHSGYLPALMAQGFHGPIYCTPATAELCRILLLDSAHIQEEDANYRNRHHSSRHRPAKPLYTVKQAEQALKLFHPVGADMCIQQGDLRVEFHPNGHILGSCCLDVRLSGKHFLFSGDLGRAHDLLMHPPQPPVYCDTLIIESTYGDRLHSNPDLYARMAAIICETVQNGGNVLIPAFAVGRAQAMLYVLQQLRKRNAIPPVPIYLDSPMAINATELLMRNHALHKLNSQHARSLSHGVTFTRTVEQSMALNQLAIPAIIISASGMATGGRVMHHLSRMLGDNRNTVVFAGYQSGGTRGARLVNGEQRIKMFGKYWQVRARIENLDFLSAHADRNEIIQWLQQMPVAPKRTFITHGEPAAADTLRMALQDELGWPAEVPDYGDTVFL